MPSSDTTLGLPRFPLPCSSPLLHSPQLSSSDTAATSNLASVSGSFTCRGCWVPLLTSSPDRSRMGGLPKRYEQRKHRMISARAPSQAHHESFGSNLNIRTAQSPKVQSTQSIAKPSEPSATASHLCPSHSTAHPTSTTRHSTDPTIFGWTNPTSAGELCAGYQPKSEARQKSKLRSLQSSSHSSRPDIPGRHIPTASEQLLLVILPVQVSDIFFSVTAAPSLCKVAKHRPWRQP